MLVMLLLCLICSCYASASLWCFYLPHSASLILWLQLDVLCAPPMFTKLGLVTVGPCCLLVVVVGVVVAISCWHLILVLPVLVFAATYIYQTTKGQKDIVRLIYRCLAIVRLWNVFWVAIHLHCATAVILVAFLQNCGVTDNLVTFFNLQHFVCGLGILHLHSTSSSKPQHPSRFPKVHGIFLAVQNSSLGNFVTHCRVLYQLTPWPWPWPQWPMVTDHGMTWFVNSCENVDISDIWESRFMTIIFIYHISLLC